MADETKIIRIVVDSSAAVDGSRSVTRALEQMEKAQASTTSALERMEAGLGRMGGFLKAQIAAQVAEFGARLLGMARNALEAAAGLDELAEQLGVSNRALQALQFSAVQNGLKMEQLETGISKFSQKMGEAANGSKEMIEALTNLGVKNLDLQGKLRPTEDLLQDVAAAIVGIDDPARRAAAAVDFFGKAGTRMLPMLADIASGVDIMSAKMERAGAYILPETSKKLDELADSAERAGLRWRATFANAAAGLLDFYEKNKGIFSFLTMGLSNVVEMLAKKPEAFTGPLVEAFRNARIAAEDWFDKAHEAFDSTVIAGGKFVGSFMALFSAIPDQIGKVFVDGMNKALQALEDGLNKLSGGFANSWLGRQLGADGGTITLGRLSGGGASQADLLASVTAGGQTMADRLRGAGYGQSYSAARAQQRQIDFADWFAKREASAAGYIPPNTTGSGTSTVAGAGKNEADAYRQLEQQLVNTAAAQRTMTAAAQAGGQAFDEAKATVDAQNKVLGIFKEQLADTDPRLTRIRDLLLDIERNKAAESFSLATTALKQQNEVLEAENRLIGASNEQRAIELALIKSRQEAEKAGKAVTADMQAERRNAIEANERLKSQGDEIKKANELWTAPLKSALESIQRTGADMWEKLLENGKFSAQEFGDIFAKMARRAAAELLALATIRPVIQVAVQGLGSLGLVSSGTVQSLGYGGSIGGAGVGGGGVGVGGASGGMGGLGGMFGGSSGLFSPGFMSQPIFGGIDAEIANWSTYGTAAQNSLAPTTWGQAFGAIGGAASMGMGAYNLINSKSTVGKISGGVGMLGGAMGMMGALIPAMSALGPIGMGVGLVASILPMLLGGDKPEVPPMPALDYGAGVIMPNGVGFDYSGNTLNNGKSLMSGAQSIGESLQSIFRKGRLTAVSGSLIGGDIASGVNNRWNGQSWQGDAYTQIGLNTPGGYERITYNDTSRNGEQAADLLLAEMFKANVLRGGVTGGSDALRTAVSTANPTTQKAVSDLVDFVAIYDQLGKTSTATEEALKAVDDRFASISESAARYGLELDKVETARLDARKKIEDQYAKSIRDATTDMTISGWGIADPMRAAFGASNVRYGNAVANAWKMGQSPEGGAPTQDTIDLFMKATENYQAERAKIVSDFVDGLKGGLQQLQDPMRATIMDMQKVRDANLLAAKAIKDATGNTEALTLAQLSYSKAIEQLSRDFVSGLTDQLLALQDPMAATVAGLRKQRDANLLAAQALADLASSNEAVSAATTLYDAQIKKLKDDLVQQLGEATFGITDPARAQFAGFAAQRTANQKQLQALGLDGGAADALYNAQVGKVVGDFTSNIKDQLSNLEEPMTAQLAALDKQYAANKLVAQAIEEATGNTEAMALATSLYEKQLAKLRENGVLKELADATLAITDPMRAQLGAFGDMRTENRRRLEVFGLGTEAADTLYNTQVGKVVEDFVKNLADQMAALEDPMRAQLRALKDQYDANLLAAKSIEALTENTNAVSSATALYNAQVDKLKTNLLTELSDALATVTNDPTRQVLAGFARERDDATKQLAALGLGSGPADALYTARVGKVTTDFMAGLTAQLQALQDPTAAQVAELGRQRDANVLAAKAIQDATGNTEGMTAATALYGAQIAKLKDDLLKQIGDATLAVNDPMRAQLVGFADQRTANRRQLAALGLGTTAADDLYGAQVGKTVGDFIAGLSEQLQAIKEPMAAQLAALEKQRNANVVAAKAIADATSNTDAMAAATALYAAQVTKLKDELLKQLGDAALAVNDPMRSQLSGFANQRASNRQQLAALGLGADAADSLYAAQVGKTVDEFLGGLTLQLQAVQEPMAAQIASLEKQRDANLLAASAIADATGNTEAMAVATALYSAQVTKLKDDLIGQLGDAALALRDPTRAALKGFAGQRDASVKQLAALGVGPDAADALYTAQVEKTVSDFVGNLSAQLQSLQDPMAAQIALLAKQRDANVLAAQAMQDATGNTEAMSAATALYGAQIDKLAGDAIKSLKDQLQAIEDPALASVKALEDQYEANRKVASAIDAARGNTDAMAAATALYGAQLAKLKDDLVKQLGDATIAVSNPMRSQLLGLGDQRTANRRQLAALGLGPDAANDLYDAQVGKTVSDFLSGLTDQLTALQDPMAAQVGSLERQHAANVLAAQAIADVTGKTDALSAASALYGAQLASLRDGIQKQLGDATLAINDPTRATLTGYGDQRTASIKQLAALGLGPEAADALYNAQVAKTVTDATKGLSDQLAALRDPMAAQITGLRDQYDANVKAATAIRDATGQTQALDLATQVYTAQIEKLASEAVKALSDQLLAVENPMAATVKGLTDQYEANKKVAAAIDAARGNTEAMATATALYGAQLAKLRDDLVRQLGDAAIAINDPMRAQLGGFADQQTSNRRQLSALGLGTEAADALYLAQVGKTTGDFTKGLADQLEALRNPVAAQIKAMREQYEANVKAATAIKDVTGQTEALDLASKLYAAQADKMAKDFKAGIAQQQQALEGGVTAQLAEIERQRTANVQAAGAIDALTGSTEAMASAMALAAAQVAKIAKEFNERFSTGLMGLTDPMRAQLTGYANQRRQDLTDARALGQSTTGVEGYYKALFNKTANDNMREIERGLLGMADPLAAQKMALDDARDAAMKAAEAINDFARTMGTTMVDTAKISEYYAKQKAETEKKYWEESLGGIEALIKRLTYGDMSGLSPTAMLSGLKGTYEATLAQARAGDLNARSRLSGEASDYVSAGREVYASGMDFQSLRETVLSALTEFSVDARGGTLPSGGATPGSPTDPSAWAGIIAGMQSVITQQNKQIADLTEQMKNQAALLDRFLAKAA